MLDRDLDRFREFLVKLKVLRDQPVALTFGIAAASESCSDGFRTFVKYLPGALGRLDAVPDVGPDVGKVRLELERAERLRSIALDLRRAFARDLPERLGAQKVETLRKYLDLPAPPILKILGKSTDENSNSDVIGWLLDPRNAPTVAPAALTRMARLLDDSPGWIAAIENAIQHDCLSVRREVVLEDEGGEVGDISRIDLLVTGPTFLLAIENKILSPEHDGQTAGYWNWLTRRPHLKTGALFLSRSGISAQCSQFKSMSYLDLLDCLLEGPSQKGMRAMEGVVLAGYLRTVADSILRYELWSMEHCQSGGPDEPAQ